MKGEVSFCWRNVYFVISKGQESSFGNYPGGGGGDVQNLNLC